MQSEVTLEGKIRALVQLGTPAAVFSRNGQCLVVNHALATIVGIGEKELLDGQFFSQLSSASATELLAVLAKGTSCAQVLEFGSHRLACQLAALTDNAFAASFVEITDLATGSLAERLLGLTPAVHLLATLPDFSIEWISSNVQEIFDMAPEEALALGGIFWGCITSPPVPFAPNASDLSSFAVGDRFYSEFTSTESGRVRWFSIAGEVYSADPLGQPHQVILSLTDISSQKEFEVQVETYMIQAKEQNLDLEAARLELEAVNGQLEEMTLVDPLTKAFNRRAFDKSLDQAFRHARRYNRQLSAIAIDIDHFKSVNDRFGHGVGDQVLQVTAEQLNHGRRDTDILARVGGEEFIILLPETGIEEARLAAERLRSAIEAVDTAAGNISASFGVAELVPADTEASFLERADKALYESKRTGRNRVSLAA